MVGSKVMAKISQPFSLRFWHTNSCWKWNSIIFSMTSVPTHINNQVKIRFFGCSQVSTLGQSWSKLTKISDNLKFDIKTWRMLFWDDFDQFWPLVNPGMIRGILVNLTWKGILSAPMSKQVVPCQFRWSHDPLVKNWYFWKFWDSAHKSRIDKIQYLQLV